MKTLMLLKHVSARTVMAQYFDSENEAIWVWSRLPDKEDWEVLYLEERKTSGHRYELIYINRDEKYPNYIICYTIKEALYLKNKIEKVNQYYIVQIKKLY